MTTPADIGAFRSIRAREIIAKYNAADDFRHALTNARKSIRQQDRRGGISSTKLFAIQVGIAIPSEAVSRYLTLKKRRETIMRKRRLLLYYYKRVEDARRDYENIKSADFRTE